MTSRTSFVALAALLSLASTTHAALLSSLLGGGTVSDGIATYSNFTYATGQTPAANAINVTASTTPDGAAVLTFSVVNGTWTTPNDSSVILFNAAFTQPINSIGLSFVASGTPTGFAHVGETATYTFSGSPIDNSLQVITDGVGVIPDSLSTTLPLAHETTALSIVKSIDISSSGGSASISSVSNTYFPSPKGAAPEPASLSLLALGLPVLLKRRRH